MKKRIEDASHDELIRLLQRQSGRLKFVEEEYGKLRQKVRTKMFLLGMLEIFHALPDQVRSAIASVSRVSCAITSSLSVRRPPCSVPTAFLLCLHCT